MKKIRTILIFLFTSSIITGNILAFPNVVETDSQLESFEPVSISNDVYDLNFDGAISPGEYFEVLDFSGMKLHYMVNGTIIYMAMEAQVTGYVSIGLGGSGMDGADIIIGYYSSGTFIQDNIGTGTVSHIKDTVDNILNSGGSDDGSKTIIEFSRYLDTGDVSDDIPIVLDANMGGTYATHSTKDDFTSTHDDRARISGGMTFQSYSPSSPRSLSGSPSDQQAILSWNAPASDGGMAITGYNIYRSTTSGSGFSFVASTAQTDFTDSGLTNGENYYYLIRAETAKGESTNSNEVHIQPTAQISEPLNPTATPQEGAVQLTWDAPLLDGGSAIVQYNVYRSETPGGPYSLIGSNTTLQYDDNSIINGINYYYIIRAENSYAEGDSSSEVSATPFGVSPVPLNLRGFATDTNISLLWDAPISDGGATITEYKIYRGSIEGGPYTEIGTNSTTTGFVDLTATLTQRYFYLATAINSYGESDPSNEYGITFAKTPYVIENVAITASYRNVTLVWDMPTGDFNPIINYTVYRFDFAQEIYILVSNTTNTYFSDVSVSNALEYKYILTAWNDQGESPYSSEYSIIPGEVPGAPLSFSAVIDDLRVELSWDEPINDGGFNISEYRVYRYDNVIYSGLNTLINDIDVINGQSYSYFVVSVNIVGEGVRSENITAIPGTIPSVPPQPQAVFAGSSVMITWNQSSNNGGYSISNYNVYKSVSTGDLSPSYVGTGLNSFEDNSFIKGVTYFYTITANNSMGESGLSLEVVVNIPLDPTPPLNLAALGGNQAVGLSWSLPIASDGLVHYAIYRAFLENGNFIHIGNSTELTYIDSSVLNDNDYWYYVTAINLAGESAPSNTVKASPAIPSEPTTTEPTNSTEHSDKDYSETFITIAIFSSLGIIGLTYVILRKMRKN